MAELSSENGTPMTEGREHTKKLGFAVLVATSAMSWLAVAALVRLLVTERYEYAYVASHVEPSASTGLKIAAAWAGSEGSLLVFLAVVATTLAVAARPSMGPQPHRVVVGQAVIVVALVLTSIIAASPFDRLDVVPLTGEGITPILDHWAMLIHPPLLYLGMAMALTPALTADAGRARRRTLGSILITTVALAIGSIWAYGELGWGGWWAWDPVENVALVVWLLLIGGLHATPSTTARTTTLALVWPAVFAGTALTRTSLRTSVHAFADNEALAWGLWPVTAVAVAVAFFIVADRHPHTRRRRLGRADLMAVGALGAAAAVVAIGTYRPFIGGNDTAGWFYSRLLTPIMVVALFAMTTTVRRRGARGVHLIANLAAGAMAGVLLAAMAGGDALQVALAAAIGASVFAQVFVVKASPARLLAHIGIALLFLGAVAGTFATRQTLRILNNGSAVVAGHSLRHLETFVASDSGQPGDPIEVVARFRIDGVEVLPSIDIRPALGLRVAETATRSTVSGDVQIVMRDADDDGVLIDVNVHPLQWMVWAGAALIAAGAVVGLMRRADPRSS